MNASSNTQSEVAGLPEDDQMQPFGSDQGKLNFIVFFFSN